MPKVPESNVDVLEVVSRPQDQVGESGDREAPFDRTAGAVTRRTGKDVTRVENIEDEVPLRIEKIAREVSKVEQATQARDLRNQGHGRPSPQEVVVRNLGLEHEVFDC